jgi:uncharacterized protein (DUF1684 family)
MIMRILLCLLSGLVVFGADKGPPNAYRAEIQNWRTERETKLKADDGWLTVAGLFWLKEGDNRAGADDALEIALPKGSAPLRVGVFTRRGPHIEFHPAPNSGALVNGKSAPSTTELRVDVDGKHDVVTVRDLSMFIIKREDKYAVRLKDKNSGMRTTFTGLQWYPVKESWRIPARWVPYNPPKKLVFDTVAGVKEEDESPGYAQFSIGGKEYRLEATESEGTLFFVIRDKTAGKATYAASRFLRADLPKDGAVILDFNKAYNPPCVFTPYATCPLPPPQNRLPIAIDAGELMYGSKEH